MAHTFDFIHELLKDDLEQFLMYVIASPVMPSQIKIKFNSSVGLVRIPVHLLNQHPKCNFTEDIM